MPKRAATDGAIELSFARGCAAMTLRYPAARASITPAMAVRMIEIFEQIEDDDEARMLTLWSGAAKFCTGFDAEVDPRLVESMAVISKPVVVVINGDAADEGLELALAADIRIVAARARIAITSAGRGAMPRFGATQRLPRLIGAANTLRVMMTGTPITGTEAARIGLATYLAANRRDWARISQNVERAIVSRAPLATRLVKDAVLKGYDMTLEQGIRLEEDLYALLQTTADRAEGIDAFLAKRKPLFKGA
ncbi:MAG TPA: enoyl-CoA hydratase/isomerase family protein [Candidatus Binataceae bacterium]|nr:enoyl-CoA hydratase/isomerase family protein [Candidatus Binataceae bacterium]